MKHTLYTLFSLALFPLCAIAQKPAVKFSQHQKYVIAEGGVLKLSFQIEQSYSKFGNLIKQEYLYPKPNSNQLQTDRKIVHSYDNNGVQHGTLEYNGDNILEAETKITWDAKGNKSKVEEIRYANGEQTSNITSYLLEYDTRGNKQSERYFTPEGEQEKIRTWEYNDKDELTRTVFRIDKKNQPKKRSTVSYKRDKDGNLLKAVSREEVNGKEYRRDVQYFNSNQVTRWRKYINGKFESEFINEYRDSVVIRTTKRNTRKVIPLDKVQRQQTKEAKRTQRAKRRARNSEIWVTNSEYDAYGNIVISTQSVNNKVVFVSQFEYDEYNNCTHSIKINKETGDKEEEMTEYETYGNVARQTIYKNGQILSEERYLYEYYPKE